MSQRHTILATDLDGTFLGGSPAERAALYGWIAARRDEITLIYVTGRDLGFVRSLRQALPVEPDHVIGNVGTTVAAGREERPIPQVERWLDGCWGADAPARIEAALAPHRDHLLPQPVVEGRRVSRFFTDATRALDAKADIERLGFDALMSDNRFFDVLPRGVRKGPTLLRTLAALDLDPARVLVAGDTLNDLSLFETGLASVAVANSEPALVCAIAHLGHVRRSRAPGAGGILEVLEPFHHQGASA